MLNQGGVTKVSAGVGKNFLYDTKIFFSLSCKIDDTSVTEVGGKKILKAGTPLTGDLHDRDSAFSKTSNAQNVVGIAMHDVDVTDGEANGAILIFGFVDFSKLDEDVQGLLTSDIQKALNITFID